MLDGSRSANSAASSRCCFNFLHLSRVGLPTTTYTFISQNRIVTLNSTVGLAVQQFIYPAIYLPSYICPVHLCLPDYSIGLCSSPSYFFVTFSFGLGTEATCLYVCLSILSDPNSFDCSNFCVNTLNTDSFHSSCLPFQHPLELPSRL